MATVLRSIKEYFFRCFRVYHNASDLYQILGRQWGYCDGQETVPWPQVVQNPVQKTDMEGTGTLHSGSEKRKQYQVMVALRPWGHTPWFYWFYLQILEPCEPGQVTSPLQASVFSSVKWGIRVVLLSHRVVAGQNKGKPLEPCPAHRV